MVCYDDFGLLLSGLAEEFEVPDVALYPTHATNEHLTRQKVFFGTRFDDHSQLLDEARQRLADLAAEHGVTRQPGLVDSTDAGLKLVFVPRAFQAAGDTFDGTYRFIGPSMGSRAESDAWGPPADGAPVLFISLGTLFNDRREFFALCTEAFGATGWRVVMAVGGAVDPASRGPVPPNFEIGPYFPQLTVLRHARAFVSHTGMNSTMEALYYRVPLISVPQMPEQGLNGDRVQELGLGRRLDPDTLTASLLRDTVREVAEDPAVRANLAKVSDQVLAGGGARAGADALEAYLSAPTRA